MYPPPMILQFSDPTGGAGWLDFRFHTKIFPVKFSLLCLAKMIVDQDTPWIDLNELKIFNTLVLTTNVQHVALALR